LLSSCKRGLRARVDPALDYGDLMQRAVQRAVAMSVEAMAAWLAGRCVEWRDAGESCELGVVRNRSTPATYRSRLTNDDIEAGIDRAAATVLRIDVAMRR
jgi:hypothetical protein